MILLEWRWNWEHQILLLRLENPSGMFVLYWVIFCNFINVKSSLEIASLKSRDEVTKRIAKGFNIATDYFDRANGELIEQLKEIEDDATRHGLIPLCFILLICYIA